MELDFENNDILDSPFMFYKHKIATYFDVDELSHLVQLFHQCRNDLFNLIEVLDNLPIHTIDYNYLFIIREPISETYELPIFNEKFFKKPKKYIYEVFKQTFNNILQDIDEIIVVLKGRRDLILMKLD